MIYTGPLLDQLLDNIHMTFCCRPLQCGMPRLNMEQYSQYTALLGYISTYKVLHRDITATQDQGCYGVAVARTRSLVESCLPVLQHLLFSIHCTGCCMCC